LAGSLAAEPCALNIMNFCRVVVKLGTSTLTAGTTQLSLPRMVDLVRQIAQLHAAGCEVILVSSGAIAAGRERLNHPQLSKDIPAKQMLAAVGQPRLMALYEQLFALYGAIVFGQCRGSSRSYIRSSNAK
jgi:glutamate 5-kinase